MMVLRLSLLMALALSLASVPATAATQPRAVAHAASAGDWTYVRDPDGNITKTTAPNGRVSETTFDPFNRPINTTYEGAGPGEVSKVTRHYDGNGNLTAVDEVIDGVTRTETRRYDHFDRLEHVTDVHGRTLDYTYDRVGNRTRMVDSDGQETVWTYNALNCNTSITVPGQGTTTQKCRPSGKLDTITHPDGSTSTTTYDNAGRIESLIHAKAGQTLASYWYRYDFNGNRIEQREINGAGEQVTEYRYDNADRLTQVIEPTRTTVYTLDPVGNRVEERVTDSNGAVVSDSILTYNERDQLTVRNDPATGTHVDQTYDPNGNLKTQQIAGTLRTYTYDGQDRLVELDMPGQALPIRFDYDPRGKRIEKSQGGQATRYQYDDQSLTAETNVIGNTLKRYHYSAQQLLSETLAGSTPVNRQFLLDALKTPIAVLTQAGAISARTRYDAWGRIISQTNDSGITVTPNRDAPFVELPSTDAQPFGFTGYVKDNESGLYYANARYYDPATARFTTEDPEAGKDLTPPSLHRYLYAYANPTVYVDPTGRQSADFADFAAIEYLHPTDEERERFHAQVDAGKAGANAAAAKFVASSVAGLARAMYDTAALEIENKTAGLVDFGARARMREARQRVADFVSNDPVGKTKQAASERWEYIREREVAGDMEAAADAWATTGLEVSSATTGVYGVLRGGATLFGRGYSRLFAQTSRATVVEGVDGSAALGLDSRARTEVLDTGPVSNRHLEWGADQDSISSTMERLGQRALQKSGRNAPNSERLFESYLQGVSNRLARTGSQYGVEIQPAAIAGQERVPNFIYLNRGGPNSALITAADGTPKLFAYPGSRRLDAGVIDLREPPNEHGLQPVVAGFDITLSATKPNIVPYYQKYFGNIPIYDIRLPQ